MIKTATFAQALVRGVNSRTTPIVEVTVRLSLVCRTRGGTRGDAVDEVSFHECSR